MSAKPVFMLLLLFMTVPAPTAEPAVSVAQEQLCNEVAGLLRAARKVLSDHQDLINDPAKGDKGLSADVVIAKTRENYEEAMKASMPASEGDALQAQAVRAMVAAERTIMDKAQSLINEPGKGFKGFLPAVFAAQVAGEFSKNMEGKIFLKLTAPEKYVRNRRNRPDAWESGIIEGRFKAADWLQGKAFSEHGEHKGKTGQRLIMPEYYGASCLKCHGDPKGETDISGGLKEGAKLGELGGAISVVVYDVK